jgi:hypothetical protein
MWTASITNNYKTEHLGYFTTTEEASEAYVKAKAELHTFNPIQRT